MIPFKRMMRLLAIAVGLLLLAGCSQRDTTTQSASQKAPVFSFDKAAVAEAKPWTSENFANNPREFQFAIIGDRTGGANVQGTFEIAMNQLNMLQPEFVINVGDIIEGYAEDTKELTAMWEEVEALTGKLEMPFFYTRGNHDVSFPGGKEEWARRHGPNYYHFIYKDVQFLVLDSEDSSRPEPPPEIMEATKVYKKLQVEDPEAARKMLAEFMKSDAIVAALGQPVEFPNEQLDWIKKTLAEHTDVRWTFLFMHEPCWENPSQSFKAIESMLKDRPYTFFAGHLHYYDYDKIKGREYITIGPAGASWHHDGPGNVDHIMWVTMTEDGPQMANIALKGVFDRKGLDPSLFGAYDRKGAATQDAQGEAKK
ncbi:MAG: metallophosphoesterase [Pseudomonadota bacterium]|nr:MAG: metallophosphoesterase [Pseudomonadota bacterium]